MTDTVHSARHPRRTGPTLADIAARYVREHRIDRQSRQLTNRQTVTLTVIQNRWAAETGRGREDITTAPLTVIHAIENTRRGHELFSRVRENKELVVYELRREGA